MILFPLLSQGSLSNISHYLQLEIYLWKFQDLFTSFWREVEKWWKNVYWTKFEESPIPKGNLEIVTQVTFKIEEGKKRFLLRLVDWIKENYETPKSEAHEIIEDEENGTSNENNSDSEDIMFFIDDKEENDLFNSCVFFLLFCYFNWKKIF